MKLTDKIIKTLPGPEPGSKRRYLIHWDDSVKGLGIRVTQSGYKSFIFNYSTKAGIDRRKTIGSVTDWTLAKAQGEAIKLRVAVDSGHDPLNEIKEEREAPNVRDLAKRFDEEHLCQVSPVWASLCRSFLDWALPQIGALKVRDVEHADIARLHRKMSKNSPIRANRMLACMSKMFSLSILWKMRLDNPCKNIPKNLEEKRERYLTPTELVSLLDVLDSYEDQQVSNILRLLLLTGARNSELYLAKRSQFNLEQATWTKRASTTKQRKLHHVELNEPALALLMPICEGKSSDEYLFLNPKTNAPYPDLHRHWARICKAAGLEGIRVYDCRHSFASTMVNANVSLPIIGRLLGHSSSKTTERYLHLYTDTLRAATAKAGQAYTDASKVSVLRRT
jgi:integrase